MGHEQVGLSVEFKEKLANWLLREQLGHMGRVSLGLVNSVRVKSLVWTS